MHLQLIYIFVKDNNLESRNFMCSVLINKIQINNYIFSRISNNTSKYAIKTLESIDKYFLTERSLFS